MASRIPCSYFQSGISPQFCFKIPNHGLQIAQIPYSEKPGHSSPWPTLTYASSHCSLIQTYMLFLLSTLKITILHLIHFVLLNGTGHNSLVLGRWLYHIITIKVWIAKFRNMPSLRSRRLDGSSGRKKEREREREPCVSPSRAPVIFCAHYFQARATQAKICPNKSSSDCHSYWMQ